MTALATQTRNGALPKPIEMPRSEAIERALVNGDLSGLSQPERMDFYVLRCEAAGLDHRSQPFQYLTLNGKIVLYATKAATDQLIASRHLSVTIVSRGFDRATGLYETTARVTFPTGQSVEDVGAVWIAEKTQGESLANAVMKCVTKAKRRTVLSACGLGMLDETEIDSIPGARVVNPDRPGLPAPVEPQPIIERLAGPTFEHPPSNDPKAETISEVRTFVNRVVRAAHDYLAGVLVIEKGSAELMQEFVKAVQVPQHFVSKWIDEKVLAAEVVQRVNKKGEVARDPVKVGAAFQVGFSQDTAEVKAEVRLYVLGKLMDEARRLGLELNEREAGEAIGLGRADADESQAAADDD